MPNISARLLLHLDIRSGAIEKIECCFARSTGTVYWFFGSSTTRRQQVGKRIETIAQLRTSTLLRLIMLDAVEVFC